MGQTCESRHNKESSIGNDQVLNQCKQIKNKIDNYIKALELKSKKAKDKAKECIRNKQKPRAKFYLKQCKLYQEKIRIAQGKLDMIENNIIMIENARTSQDTIKALREGNKALKELNTEVNLKELESAKEELDDLKEDNKEMSEFFKDKENEVGEECENEFKELVKEVEVEKTNNNNIKLPNVPNNAINAGQVYNNNININNQKLILNQ